MAGSEVVIEAATELSSDLVAALGELVSQLSTNAVADQALLERVIAAGETTLLVARVEDRVVGMCSLVTYAIPTGIRCWIEDVVVDDEMRGRGIGASLVAEAIARARELGAKTVDLTSRPSRVEANRLYERSGFARRETNVYRFQLDD